MNIRSKKVFSMVLIVCLLLSVCSGVAVPVRAAEASGGLTQPVAQPQPVADESISQTESASLATQEAAEVTVVREEESLRGEFEKHFLMSDGTYQAVVYSYPVHELVNGVWVELPIPEQTARGNVSPGNAQQNIIDNYVWQNHGVQDNNSVRLYIGKRSGNECRAFIRFATMPTIPAGATITAATMTVNIVSGTSTAYNAKASQVTGSWESTTIQWSNMPTIGAVLENNISHNNKTKYEFSCLAAVQHWYDGSTTGQNENYGIMLQYADSTIADYNSFYSADCTDSTMRPSMTISYDPAVITEDEISVQEGYLAQLPLPNISGTITWTSANESVATVNSNGVVTGIKAGKVTVTASVEDVVTYTYTVYVKIKEGPRRVYCANTNYYLSVGGGMLEDAGLWIKNASNEGLPLYRQVWKIYYLAQGYYVIRPLHNQNMALCAKDGVCSVTTIGSSNYLIQVPEENRWTIEWVNGGYVFKCQGDSSQTLRSLYNAPDVRAYTGEYMSSNNVFQWNFSDSPDIQPEVLLLNSKTGEIAPNIFHGILPKQSTTLADLDLTATFVCTAKYLQAPTWSSSAESSISVNATTGVIKGDTVGNMATITVKYGNNSSYYTRTISFVVVPFTEGTFFVENFASQRYLQTIINEYIYEDHVQQFHFTGGDNQKWIFTLLNDGYFSIVSAQTGFALSVPSGQEGNADVTLIQEEYRGLNRQKWRISTAGEYHYKIKAKSAEAYSADLAIAVGTTGSNTEDGLDIQQRVFVSDDFRGDEWLFLHDVIDVGISSDNYTGGCLSGGRSSSRYASIFTSNLLGHTEGMLTATHHANTALVQRASPEDFSVDGAMSRETDFMIYIGHGHLAHDTRGNHLHYDCARIADPHTTDEDTGAIIWCDPTGNVYSNEICFGSDTSDLRWVWLYTCNFLNASEDAENNDGDPTNNYNPYVTNSQLAERMMGAHIVMGYASKATLCDAMVEDFATYLRNGMPIYNAYLLAGNTGEASVEVANHHQKIMYIPQARYETIYSPAVRYECDAADIIIDTHSIHDEFVIS